MFGGMGLKPLIMEDETEEFDTVDLVGDGGARRGGAGNENIISCERPGLALPGLKAGEAGGRIFK